MFVSTAGGCLITILRKGWRLFEAERHENSPKLSYAGSWTLDFSLSRPQDFLQRTISNYRRYVAVLSGAGLSVPHLCRNQGRWTLFSVVLTMTEFWWLISIALVPLSARHRTPGTLNIIITTTTNTNHHVFHISYSLSIFWMDLRLSFYEDDKVRCMLVRWMEWEKLWQSDTNMTNRII